MLFNPKWLKVISGKLLPIQRRIHYNWVFIPPEGLALRRLSSRAGCLCLRNIAAAAHHIFSALQWARCQHRINQGSSYQSTQSYCLDTQRSYYYCSHISKWDSEWSRRQGGEICRSRRRKEAITGLWKLDCWEMEWHDSGKGSRLIVFLCLCAWVSSTCSQVPQ